MGRPSLAPVSLPSIPVPPVFTAKDDQRPVPFCFSIPAAAHYIGVSESTMKEILDRGEIVARKSGGRVFILRTDLEAWVLSQPLRAVPA